MITLRMLGIAAALLLALPVGFVLADHVPGHATVPGGQILEMSADAVAEVTDITLVEPPVPQDRLQAHNAPEQLVEGHTVFVTWDIQLVPNVTNWTLDITGFVECENYANVSGEYAVGGVPVPTRIDRVYAECRAGEVAFATPDPFYDSEDTYQSQMAQPNGRYIPFTAPNGETGYATEYEYEVASVDWLGQETRKKMYMWSAPVLPEWLHSDGKPRSWYCPLPVDRLQEMGVTSFSAYLEGDARLPSIAG